MVAARRAEKSVGSRRSGDARWANSSSVSRSMAEQVSFHVHAVATIRSGKSLDAGATAIVDEVIDLSCSSSAPTSDCRTEPHATGLEVALGSRRRWRRQHPDGAGPAMWGPLVGGDVWYTTSPSASTCWPEDWSSDSRSSVHATSSWPPHATSTRESAQHQDANRIATIVPASAGARMVRRIFEACPVPASNDVSDQ